MSLSSPLPASPNLSPPTDRILGLDLLRVAAILSVLEGHALEVFYPHWSKIGLLGHGGFYGVELFFVLSGFLIGGILLRAGDALRDPTNLATFYLRRWFRTLPLFWLFIGINLWLEWHLHQRVIATPETLKHTFFIATFAANHIGFIPESFSLAIEEWFYLLFPAVLWLGLQAKLRFRTIFLAAVGGFYLFSTIGRVLSAANPRADWSGWQRVLVIYRFDALMIGVFAAWLAQSFPDAWRRVARPAGIMGLLLSLAMYASLWRPEGDFVTAAADSFFARTFRFNLVSLGFALLLPAMSGWSVSRESLWTWPIRKIALWSYAIYLVNQPVIHLVRQHLFMTAKTSAPVAALSFATQVVGTIALSALLYRFYEAPITRLRDRFAPQSHRAS